MKFALIAAAAAVSTACAVATAPARDDRAAIAEESRRFSAAYVRGDADAMAAIYADGAVLIPPERDVIRGRAAIRAYWTLPAGRTVTRHESAPEEIVVEGDLAYDWGYYTVSGETGGEAWGPARGKYLIVWIRGADGRWRMASDAWSRLGG